MRLQYIHDGVIDAPLLVFDGRDPRVVAALREALHPEMGRFPISLDELPGIEMVDAVRVTASIGDTDLGARRDEDGRVSWVLTIEGWEQVVGLLAPFTTSLTGNAFQYLSQEGPVTVIISTDGRW